MTPIGTFEKEVGAATFRDGTLLIATKEYVDAYLSGSVEAWLGTSLMKSIAKQWKLDYHATITVHMSTVQYSHS